MSDSILNIDTTGTPSLIVSDATADLRAGVTGTGAVVSLISHGLPLGRLRVYRQTLTLSGATTTATGIIPAGCVVLGVRGRVTTAITGATSSNIGDGTTANAYGATVAIAAGTQFGLTNFLAATQPFIAKAAGNVVFTAVGSNYTAGVVVVEAVVFEVFNLEAI